MASEGWPATLVNEALLAACRAIDPEPIAALALELADRESLPLAELARLAGGFALATSEYLSAAAA